MGERDDAYQIFRLTPISLENTILYLIVGSLSKATTTLGMMPSKIKVLCEQTREANKQIKMFFGLCLILFGFGNIVADFHVLFIVRGN